MIETKIIETVVDLSIADMYSGNVKEILLENLRKRLVGICMYMMRILEVTHIVKYTSVRMNIDLLNGAACSTVMAEIKGIVLTPGELLNNCVIQDVTSISITAKGKYYGINIRNSDVNNIIKVGDIVPLVVVDAVYNIGKPDISVTANIYTPVRTPPIVHIISQQLNDTERVKLTNLFTRINEEILLHAKINDSKQYGLFQSLLHGYAGDQKYELSTDVKKYSLLSSAMIKNFACNPDIMDINCYAIVVNDQDHKKHARIWYSNTMINTDITTVNSSMYAVLYDIYTSQLIYLQGLREMVETYVPGVVEKTTTYLAYCKKQQRQ